MSMEMVPVGEDPLVVTVEQAAVLLGISRGLAYELVRQGVIPSIRLGRRLVVPRRRLLGMIEGDHQEVGA
jgi:excisionase family DNA binding protein